MHFLFLNRCIKNLPREKFPFAPQVNFIRTHYLLPTWWLALKIEVCWWHERFEVIPRNSSSLLDCSVRDIHNYYMEHSLRLNPRKCLFTYSEKDLSSTQRFLEKYCETSQMRPLKVHEKLAVIGSFSWLVTWYINTMLAQDKQTNSSHHFRCSLPSGFFSSQHCVFLTTWLTNRKGPKKKWPY